jgi:hypothetical protein
VRTHNINELVGIGADVAGLRHNSKAARQRRSHIFPKDKDGWYCEASWVSRRLFEVENFPDPIYDPACGWGTILKAAEAAGSHCWKRYCRSRTTRTRREFP